MDSWKLRFEDLIHEVNGQPIPSIVRREELLKVVQSHLADNFQEVINNDFWYIHERIAFFYPLPPAEFIEIDFNLAA